MAVSHFCSCASHACSSQPGGRRRVTKDALRRHGADHAVRRLRMLHERQAQADSAQASASSSRAGFALPPLPRDARPVHHMRAESPTQRPGGAPAACVESDSDATSFGDDDDSGMMWDDGGDNGFDAPAFGLGLTGVDLPKAMSPTRPASPLRSPVPSLLQTDPASSERSFSRKPDSDAEMTGDESPAAFVTVDDDAQHTADSAGAHAMSLVERTLQHRSMQDAALQLAPPVRHSGTLIVPSGLDLTAAFYALLLWLLSGGTSVPQIVVLLVFWKTRVLPALAASAREAALTPAVISIDACRGHIGVDARLQRFALCPSSSCHALHAIRTTDGRPIDACKECGTPLLGPTGLPLSIFAVYSLKDFIASLLIQPKVEDALMREFVRERTGRSDFCDGTAWSDGFETNKLSLTFALGCDGFQPLKGVHTSTHSSGGIMAMCLSLPPLMRTRRKYIFLNGCTPGPRGKSHPTMWRFLKPLVGELIELHAGLRFQTASTLAAGISEGRLVRVRMLCFLGDWVERTKIGGLPAHGAACPCLWCMITSSPEAQVRSLSEPYPPQDAAAHCKASLAARELPSNAARNRHAEQTGARYSVLYAIPGWKSVDCMPVDAMHGLHLGWLKRFWKATLQFGGMLTARDVEQIQQDVIRPARLPQPEAHLDPQYGTAGGGSSTAAQNSTFMRILLLVALICVWGDSLVSSDRRAPPSSLVKFDKERAIQALRSSGAYTNVPAPSASPSLSPALSIRSLLSPAPGTSPQSRGSAAEPPSRGKAASPQPLSRFINKADVIEASLHLAAVADLCELHSMDDGAVAELEQHQRAYIEAQVKLFGADWLVPYSHALMHLPNHVRCFAPPRHMSAYTFKHMNAVIGAIRTNNHRNGTIEATFTRTFAHNGQARALASRFAEQDVPSGAFWRMAHTAGDGSSSFVLRAAGALSPASADMIRMLELYSQADIELQSGKRAVVLGSLLTASTLDADIYSALLRLHRSEGHLPSTPGAPPSGSAPPTFNRAARYTYATMRDARIVPSRARANASSHHRYVVVDYAGTQRAAELLDVFTHRLSSGAPSTLYLAVRPLAPLTGVPQTHPVQVLEAPRWRRLAFSLHSPLLPDVVGTSAGPLSNPSIIVLRATSFIAPAALMQVTISHRPAWIAKARMYNTSSVNHIS